MSSIDGGESAPVSLVEPFELFYEREYRAALKLATLLLRDGERAKEAVHDVFVSAFRRCC